jgi:hypothetical protein
MARLGYFFKGIIRVSARQTFDGFSRAGAKVVQKRGAAAVSSP